MTTTEFITLGTAGGPVPKANRVAPCHAVVRGDHAILVDCGEGAMRQLRRIGVDFRDLHDIVLTHHHFDHIGSLFACIGINMMMQRKTPLSIYGPPGTARIVEGLCRACDVPCEIGFGIEGQDFPHPRGWVKVTEFGDGDSVTIGDVRVTGCENTHYRPEAEIGQPGPVSLSLRFDAPDRSIVFTGDTGPCGAVERLARGADLLVGELMDIEGTMDRVRRQNPHMTPARIEAMARHMAAHHLTPEDLGDMAARAGVAKVVAVHIPLETITPATAPAYVARVASRFSGEIVIAEDLDRF